MFPVTDDSATIVDCLAQSAQTAGIEILKGAAVHTITRESADTPFLIHMKSQRTFVCDRLLLATGSHPLGYRLAASLGHELISPVPSLFTFNIADPRLKDLAGVSIAAVQAKLLVEGHKPLEQTGPLLITHWGMSGPAILKLSAWGARMLHESHYRGTLQVNWVPHLSIDALREALMGAKVEYPKRAVINHNPISLPQRLWQRLVSAAGIKPDLRWADCSKQALSQLLQELQQGCFEIRGKGVFKEEFVTCGGIPLKEVNFKTMESRCCPGLYLAGEILNIDGVTGGFNFQNAWTTGWIAGQAMGER
jgi:hypothetical protein